MDKNELIITALQQRIGEMSASFELEKAMLRAEYTELVQNSEEMKKTIEEYSKIIEEKSNC